MVVACLDEYTVVGKRKWLCGWSRLLVCINLLFIRHFLG